MFDSVDDASRAEGGVYYERQDELPQVFYQVGYHGTPYIFDAFTLAHIGSGEGAQTHGWGLFFVLSRHTAEDCACRLSSWIDDVQLLKLSRSLKKTEATSLLRHHSWEPLFWCCSKFPIFSTSFSCAVYVIFNSKNVYSIHFIERIVFIYQR